MMIRAKQLLWRILAAVTGSFSQSGFAVDTGQAYYPGGSQQSFIGPEAYFTGEVRVDMLFPENESAPYSGAYVTFQPGARTAWHYHPAGQHMIVTHGTGLTGTRDGKIVKFKAGETVWCPPDVDHWHGAAPDAPMTHLVITGSLDGKNVVWKEKVSDAQYYGGTQPKHRELSEPAALSLRTRHIIPIAAFTANGRQEALKRALQDGLDAGLTVNEIKEIQIHLYAYAGFPRALNGLATLMAVLEERKARGIEDKLGEEATPLPANRSSLELGREVQTRLAGRPVTGPLFDFAPAINTFLQSHLFGDLFGRGILDYQSREIATLSALASLEGVDSQLNAHIAIASNVGVTEEQIAELAVVLTKNVGEKEGYRAEQAVQAVLLSAQAPAETRSAEPQKETAMTRIHVIAGDATLSATLDDTPAGRDFAALLPLELSLSDYHATEKIADLPRALDTSDAPASYTPKSGDITYYAPWGNLAIFYKPFSNSRGLVRLGAFDGPIDALLKDGAITVRLEAAE